MSGVRLPASCAAASLSSSLLSELNSAYVGRVLPPFGVVLACWAIDDLQTAMLPPAEGHIQVDITFRLLIASPPKGSVCIGRVVGADETGLVVSMAFLEGILIPAHLLRADAYYDAPTRAWCYDHTDAASGEVTRLDMRVGDTVRFRVYDVTFTNTPVGAPGTGTLAPAASASTPGMGAAASSGGAPGGGGDAGSAAKLAALAAAAPSNAATTAHIASLPERAEWMVVGGEEGDGAHVPLLRNTVFSGVPRPEEHAPFTGAALLFPPLPVSSTPEAWSATAVRQLMGSNAATAMFLNANNASATSPAAAAAAAAAASAPASGASAGVGDLRMVVVGKITEDGMGCVDWWDAPADASDAAMSTAAGVPDATSAVAPLATSA